MPLAEIADGGLENVACSARFQHFEWLTGLEHSMGLAQPHPCHSWISDLFDYLTKSFDGPAVDKLIDWECNLAVIVEQRDHTRACFPRIDFRFA